MAVLDFSERDQDGRWEMASVYRNNRSLATTVPCEIAKQVGIEEGTRLKVTETENGFHAEVIDL